MLKKINETLKERGNCYGTFENNCNITQALCNVLKTAPSYKQLTDNHIETYHMIFHKIARSVCGDPMYIDNIHDIIGYATLLEEYLINKEIEAKRIEEEWGKKIDRENRQMIRKNKKDIEAKRIEEEC